MTTDESDIRDLLTKRDDALARGDAAAVVATTDPDIVSFDLQPPLRLTGAAARDPADLDAWLATWDGPITSRFTDPVIHMSGDLAVAHGLTNLRGDKKDQGSVDAWFRSSFVLVRRASGWRIVHEHHSFPMKMDGSNLVASDLNP
ncbi:YybH family protein [Paraburkholderia franconis]|nr:nuclear transport factor 2 family protein [Paraburkholderia franconis]